MNKNDKVVEMALALRRKKQIEDNKDIEFTDVNLVLDQYRIEKLTKSGLDEGITRNEFIKRLIDLHYLDQQTGYIKEILLNNNGLTDLDLFQIVYK